LALKNSLYQIKGLSSVMKLVCCIILISMCLVNSSCNLMYAETCVV
jgi:hypothetical protein